MRCVDGQSALVMNEHRAHWTQCSVRRLYQWRFPLSAICVGAESSIVVRDRRSQASAIGATQFLAQSLQCRSFSVNVRPVAAVIRHIGVSDTGGRGNEMRPRGEIFSDARVNDNECNTVGLSRNIVSRLGEFIREPASGSIDENSAALKKRGRWCQSGRPTALFAS